MWYFGPLLDAPPAHPDINLPGKYLNTSGMQYAHLSVDLQLYQISCLVQWSDNYRWTSLVLHPGMMYTLMSFLGCIGTLTKASGVDVLLTATFGWLAGIITGKSWTNALSAYRLITIVLLQDFFHNGAKTYVLPRSWTSTQRQSESTRFGGSGCTVWLNPLF